MDSRVPIISLVGNIGAGKTTFLKRLDSIKSDERQKVMGYDYVVVFEPVDLWTKPVDLENGEKDMSILEMFYKDNKKYAFAFQMFTLQTRFEYVLQMAKEHPNKLLICERCPISDFKIFAQMLYDAKILNNQEFMVYKKWFDMMFDILQPNIVGIAYLNVPIAICAERIIKRDRKGEGSITMEYLHSLHDVHDKWLSKEVIVNSKGNLYPIYQIEFTNDKYDIDLDKFSCFVKSVIIPYL